MSDEDDIPGGPSRKKARLQLRVSRYGYCGRGKRRFVVHTKEICARSEFFKAACSERWTKTGVEQEERPVDLKDADPDIFDIYLYCVYKDKVDVGDLNVALNGEGTMPNEVWEQIRLIKAYTLADRLLDPISANMIIDAIVALYVAYDGCPTNGATAIVANNTPLESPLRRLFIDSFSRQASLKTTENICSYEAIPRCFISEILQQKVRLEERYPLGKVQDIFDVDFVKSQNNCNYHQHNSLHPICGEGCEKKEQSAVETNTGKCDG